MSMRAVVSGGGQIWKVAVTSPGAAQIRVHFKNFDVGDAEVWVHAPSDESGVAPFTGKGIFGDGEFWSASVEGDTAIISLRGTAPRQGTDLPFEIDQVAHQWASANPLADSSAPSAEASCHLDAACYSEYSVVAKAVGMFTVISSDGDGVYSCSGSFINARANSLKLYFLTANHCTQNDAEARTVEARFFYQSATCNGTPPPLTSLPRVLGARYLTGGDWSRGDFALLELTSAPQGVYFLGWNVSLDTRQSVVGIHHPRGSHRRISFGGRGIDRFFTVDGQLAPANLYYFVQWGSGIIEPGSSGSPLLNSNFQLVGTASAGPAIPPAQNICWYPEAHYGRFEAAYESLRPYLDNATAPGLTVSSPSMSFAVVDGVAPQPRTLTVGTPSPTPLAVSVQSNQPWLRASGSGSASSASPANFTVSIDPSTLLSPGTLSGTITVSSPSAPMVNVSVQVSISYTKSIVSVAVSPNPVYPQFTPDPTWSFTVRAVESAGVATRLTRFKVGPSDFSSRIANLFGAETLNAGGALSAVFALTNRSAPVSDTIELGGVDVVTGRSWLVTSGVSLAGTSTRAALTLAVTPNPVRQNPTAPRDCQWSHQLQLRETGGVSVQLSRFIAGGFDFSSRIREFFGSTSLASNGALSAEMCWSSVATPATLSFELGGTDSRGNAVSVQALASFLGPGTVQWNATPGAVSFSGTTGSPVSSQARVELSDPTAPWTASLSFGSNPSQWLTATPLTGVGSGTITLSPVVAGLSPGSYQATLVIQCPAAVPQVIHVPVSFTLTAAGDRGPTIAANGIVNGASFQAGAAPGMLMSIFGTNLASTTEEASSVPLPATLGGALVTVNGVAAPLFFASPTQLNVQVPFETAPGIGLVAVSVNGRSATSSVLISSLLPGIFSADGRTVPFPSGHPGDVLILYVTGQGSVSPAVPTGSAPASGLSIEELPRPIQAVRLTIGGLSAPVLFAGTPPGLVGVTQINFQVPEGLTPGGHRVIVTVGNQQSPQAVFTVARD